MEDIIEIPGKGIMGMVNNNQIKIGSHNFIIGSSTAEAISSVYVSINGIHKGYFKIKNHYRNEIFPLLRKLKKQYSISILSGDNEAEKINLENAIGKDAKLLFNQQPVDKMNYIKQLQQNGNLVMMIGDGLNDAGALRQSNIGIAVTESTNNFTPASDAIAEVSILQQLQKFISMAKANKQIVMASFILSILYNVIGLYFAVQGVLSSLVAAILMPASSISIILITFGSSTLVSKFLRLK
jgi:Cu+-exporting ATPase